jgi:N-carbamoyl-L-amino-acid hydrolase
MKRLNIDEKRFSGRLHELGRIGVVDGKRTRLAASDADKQARDAVARWMEEIGLEVKVDRIGNQFGIWRTPSSEGREPVMIGSHIDSVIDAGMYDGCYGVIASLEVVQTLKDAGFSPARPIVVSVFTNEEGVRYAPDMMGSLVYAGGMTADDALAAVGTDGTIIGDELARIGYAGTEEPGFIRPCAFVELHIEQGPILDSEGIPLGAVETLQGISWQRILIQGAANHAGTTPMRMRKDAGQAAAKVIGFVGDRAKAPGSTSVATVGCIEFEPNAINVIPSRAVFTVDLRNPDEQRLRDDELALERFLEDVANEYGVTVTAERLVRFEPVVFDEEIVGLVEMAASGRGLASRRMTSGAGQDAQMIARICPTAMIFVPSKDGISHNPNEFTEPSDLIAGANVLLYVVQKLAEKN